MVELLDSVAYETLDELQETHKPGHPDVEKLKEKYGADISFQRVMNRAGVIPRFQLNCYAKYTIERRKHYEEKKSN